jgi:hypothetical protein
MLFGVFAGLLLGGVVGAVSCWLVGLFESLWQWVLIGALIGPFGGAIIGTKTVKAQGELIFPDIATYIGAIYGSLLTLLLVIGGGTAGVSARLAAFLGVGSILTGPMAGLLVGAILDRAYEASLKKSWGKALGYGGTGIVICVGIVWSIAMMSSRTDPKVVADKARTMILKEWQTKPELRGATIEKITLVHKGDNIYTGVVEARVGGVLEQLTLEVFYEDGIRRLELKEME